MENFCKIKKIYQLIHEIEYEIQQKHGLSANECLTICSISRGFETAGALSKSLSQTKPRMSKILVSLERKGFINRAFDGTDKRRIIFTLTESGKLKAQQAENSDIEIPEFTVKCP